MPIEFKISPGGAEYNGTELTRILANDKLIYYQPYTFTQRKDNTYEVSGVKAGETLPEAPSLPISYRGTTVTAIGEGAFKGRTDIKTITIPDTYTQIGKEAFSGCSNLETLTVSEKCKTFGSSAFAYTTIKKVYATSLDQWLGANFVDRYANPLNGGQAELYLGGSLLTTLEVSTDAPINAYAFVNYKKLAAVVFNSGAGGTIDTGAFSGTGIQTLNLWGAKFTPGSSGAFANCNSLRTVNLPQSLTDITIPKSTFSNCGQLNTVSGTYCITEIGESVFYNCKSLSVVTLPAVKTIGASAFQNCTALTSIVIPKSLVKVSDNAFNGTSLTRVYYEGNNAGAWNKIVISDINNSALTGAARYYYSEIYPGKDLASRCWTYEGGVPTTWDSNCLANGHTTTSAATCTEGVYCDVCHNIVINPLGHDYELIAEVPATCTAEGHTAHQRCKRCQHKEGYQVIPALGHSHELIPYEAPTCYAPGHTDYQICHCGDTIGYEVIPQLQHEWEEIKGKEPTCTEPGYSAYKKCKLCGEVQESEELSATGHTEGGWIVDKESTCIEKGSQHKECTVCGEILKTEDLSNTKHTAGDWIVDKESTCTEEGSKHNNCTCCGKVLTTEVISAKGHKPGEWVTETEPTCTEPGYKYKACTVCGEKLEEVEIPATGHSYELRVDEDGKPYQYCTICGEIGDVFIYNLVDDSYSISVVDGAQLSGMVTIPAEIGGTPVTQIAAGAFKNQTQIESIIMPDSITAIGAEAFSGCKGLFRIFYQGTKEQWDAIEKTDAGLIRQTAVMFYVDETDDRSGKYWGWDESRSPISYCDHASRAITPAKAPTCIKDGTTRGVKCSYCKTVLTPVEVDPATGHTPGDWETTTEQTCTSSGIRRKYCTVCGQMADMEILPAGHTYGEEIPALEVTCTENGHTAYRECTRCGHKDGYVKLMSQGHTWGERVPAKEATCEEKGWNSYATCTKCGETTGYREIKAKGHSWGEGWIIDIEPTETVAGSQHRTCVRCGKTETETIPINPVLKYLDFAEIQIDELAEGYKVRAKAGTTYTGAVEIPAVYKGKPVVAIDKISTYISPTSLTIPDSVVEIMEDAFSGSKDLKRLIIPDSVKQIQSRAFAGCENLEQLSLGAGLSYLSYEAFNDCTKLKHVIVGSKIKLTGNTSFKGCPNITFVYYKGTASEWSNRKDPYLGAAPITAYYSATQPTGDGCYWMYNPFSWSDNLAVIWTDLKKFECEFDARAVGYLLKLKKGVKLSGVVALPHVYKGQRIVGLADRALMQDEYVNEKINAGTEDNPYYIVIQTHKINAQEHLKGVIIPETYTYIGAGAFGYCYNMGTLFVPNNIKVVGRGAFYQTTYCGETRSYSLKVVDTGEPIYPPLLDEEGYPVYDEDMNVVPDTEADPIGTVHSMKLVVNKGKNYGGKTLTIMFEDESASDQWHPQWQEGMRYTTATKSSVTHALFFAAYDEYNDDKTVIIKKAGQQEKTLVSGKKYKLGFRFKNGDIYMVTDELKDGNLTLKKWEDRDNPPPGVTLTAKRSGEKYSLSYVKEGIISFLDKTFYLRPSLTDGVLTTTFDTTAFYYSVDSLAGTIYGFVKDAEGRNFRVYLALVNVNNSYHTAYFREGDPCTVTTEKGTEVLWGKTFEDYLHPETSEDDTEALNVSGTDQTVASAESITIPDSYLGKAITGIADNAFAGAVATGATIGSNVKSIGAGAFNGAKLKSITIPLNVDVIKPRAFANCKDIKILCEAQSKPDGWAEDWCDNTAEVIWGYCSNHYFETQIIEPTCELPGMTVHFCPTCGDYYTEDIVEPLGHTWEHTESLAATCETQSCDVYICSTCGAVKGDDFAPALGHDWTEWDRISTPTCTMNGFSERRCRRCRHTDSWIIPPLGHIAGDWIVDREPTLTVEGKKHKECITCGEILEVEYTPKIGAGELDGLRFEPINGGQYAVRAASTSLSGDIVIPSRFNGVLVSEIAADGFSGCHNITSVKITEGVSLIGARAFADCSSLQRVILPESVKSIHEYAFSGCTSLECFVLGGKVENIGEAALPKDLGRDYIYITSTEYDWYSDEHRITVEKDNGLIYGQVYFYMPDPPISAGKFWRYVDGEIVIWAPSDIGACQHDYGGWTTTDLPTCTRFGAMQRTCKLCGKVEIDFIAPLGHTSSDWIIDLEPTVQAEGAKHKECTRCGEILETVSMPKLEDPYTYLVTESGEFLTDEQGNLLII